MAAAISSLTAESRRRTHFNHVPQALVGLERGASCFSNPVVPDEEGLTLLPYTGDECLTYEGEINKMATNVAFGRYG